MIHVYRPGLFGLISIRTKMSCGYGFHVRTGSNVRIDVTEKDELGNCVSMKKRGDEGEDALLRTYNDLPCNVDNDELICEEEV